MSVYQMKTNKGTVVRLGARQTKIFRVSGTQRGPRGAQGPIGPKGVAGATGPAGPAGTNGSNGAPGAAGTQGVAGPAGSTPAFTIGTVSTLSPGVPATATVTGTPQAPVLNLGIPRSGSNTLLVNTVKYAQKNLTSSGVPALVGTIDGANAQFTVPESKYVAGSLCVHVNGSYEVLGESIQQTNPATGVFTFVTAPAALDQISVSYQPETTSEALGGVSEAYVASYVAGELANRPTTAQMNAAIAAGVDPMTTVAEAQALIDAAVLAFEKDKAFRFLGGMKDNYVAPAPPFGQAADWAAVAGVYINSAKNVWVRSVAIADTPAPTTTPPETADVVGDVLAAAAGLRAMHMDADFLMTDHASPQTTGSFAYGRALTVAVLKRDQDFFDRLNDAARGRFYRKSPRAVTAGISKLTNCFGSGWDITNDAITNWGVRSADQLVIMAAFIRAWNLWGRVQDRDMASGIAYDIKTYLVNTDEGRAYLAADDAQKIAGNGHHLYNNHPIWANEIGGINPVILRMAKTFTGDAIFDQLLFGFYDMLPKVTSNSGALATTVGLPPRYNWYDGTDHSVGPIVNNQIGWVVDKSTDFDHFTAQIIGNLYEDYKLYNEQRALNWLTGPFQTFLKAQITAGAVYTVYTHAGVAAGGSLEDATTYRRAYLALTCNDPNNAQAATLKANKIPYPAVTTTVNGNTVRYFNNQKKGVAAVASRDGDTGNLLTEMMISGLWADLPAYGANANAGTTNSPDAPATTPTNPNGNTGGSTGTGAGQPAGGGTVTTAPPSDGTGITITPWYDNGAAPNLSQTQRLTIARGEFDKFKALSFVKYHCNPDGTNQVILPDGQARVMIPDETNDDPRKTNTEAAGYGMMATVFFGNPKLPAGIYDPTAKSWFDGFWKYYKRFMSSRGLIDWKILSNGTVVGTGGASDGDFDMAMALVMAHRMWGSTGAIKYDQEASNLINAILTYEFVPLQNYGTAGNTMTNGDLWGFDNPTYFPDYFAPGWFREFYKHTGNSRWLDIIAKNYPIAQGYFYNPGKPLSNINGLQTDINRDGSKAGYGGPILGYNNIRYPWRISADFLWNGSATNTLAHDAPARMVARGKIIYGNNPVTPVPDGQTINPYSGTSGICAEPAVDYSYWNGLYRNASYVQAYGVAGTVDAAHTNWAAACMTWLQNDNEQNYFGRSLSCMATMLMAGMMTPATPTGTGSTATPQDPVVVTPPATNSPSAQYALYNFRGLAIHNYMNALPAGTKKDRYGWACNQPMAFWSGPDQGWDQDALNMKAYIDQADAKGQVALVVTYGIPGRDLGQYSAGGASNRTFYETWIKKVATAIGTRKVVMDYEPDSLPQSLSLSDELKTGRYSMMKWAIAYLKAACPNLFLYDDVGHSQWVDPRTTANMLLQIGIDKANGITVNTSNFRPDSECENYALTILNNLNMPQLRFIYDTGRNGGQAPDPGRWANPAGRRFGKLPQFGNTNVEKCDGWFWWKNVGESDGNSGDGAPNAGQFWATYLYNDGVGDNVGGGNNDLVSATSGMLQRPPTPGVTGTP